MLPPSSLRRRFIHRLTAATRVSALLAAAVLLGAWPAAAQPRPDFVL